MCGRFALPPHPDAIVEFFKVADLELYAPRYNIAPTQPIMVVAAAPMRAPGSNLPSRELHHVRWGFVPSWAKNPKDLPLLINARAETAAEKNTFRAAMRHRRVLVPASGFFEWKREGKGKANPYYVRPKDGGLMAFGGLMETWSEPGGSEIDTAAILTIPANAQLSAIHTRMPVVIRPEDFDRWLDCLNNEPRDVADAMRPAEPGFFEAIPVSDRVNKVANDDAGLLEPVPESEGEKPAVAGARPAEKSQLDLF